MLNKSKEQMTQTKEQDHLQYLEELFYSLQERGLTETASKVQQQIIALSK